MNSKTTHSHTQPPNWNSEWTGIIFGDFLAPLKKNHLINPQLTNLSIFQGRQGQGHAVRQDLRQEQQERQRRRSLPGQRPLQRQPRGQRPLQQRQPLRRGILRIFRFTFWLRDLIGWCSHSRNDMMIWQQQRGGTNKMQVTASHCVWRRMVLHAGSGCQKGGAIRQSKGHEQQILRIAIPINLKKVLEIN